MPFVKVLGRAWLWDEDPADVELWVHDLEPTDVAGSLRSGEDWARDHFAECYTDADLRKLFDVPAEGNFQVLFKGKVEGERCGPWEAPDSEWDEWFEVEEVKVEPVPQAFVEYMAKPPLIIGVKIEGETI